MEFWLKSPWLSRIIVICGKGNPLIKKFLTGMEKFRNLLLIIKTLKNIGMKKQILSIFVIVGCICVLESNTFGQGTTITANLGPVISHIIGDSESYMVAIGAQAGVEASLPFNCSLPLTAWAGLNFSMQGARWEDDWGIGLIQGTTRLLYLNIPLTGRYTFENGFFVEAGVQPGFRLSAKDKYEGDSYDIKDLIKTFDFSIPLGIGYNFPNNFGVNVRVIPGVINVNQGDWADYNDHNFAVVIRALYTILGN